MNPPKIEICFEGYNTEQTDFYISSLIEKCSLYCNLYEDSVAKIKQLEYENEKLRADFIALANESGVDKRLKAIEKALNIEPDADE